MSCDTCEFRNDCHIRKAYQESKRYNQEEDIDKLREISNMLELHESYIVDMRRDVNSRLVELSRRKRAKSN
ncbi:hypothetical protein GF319_15830 [Candidatus Bathyarchaeota archaeon]|nr:hypothetical protein [Candidatus Bathyarchaeota archaeon]